MQNAYVIGAYSTQFKKWPDLTDKQLARETFVGVLQKAGWKDGEAILNAYFSNCGMGVLWNQDSVRGHSRSKHWMSVISDRRL